VRGHAGPINPSLRTQWLRVNMVQSLSCGEGHSYVSPSPERLTEMREVFAGLLCAAIRIEECSECGAILSVGSHVACVIHPSQNDRNKLDRPASL